MAPYAGRETPSNFENFSSDELISLLGEVLSELCVDQRRTFGVGNGSGGRALMYTADRMASSGKPLGLRFAAVGVVGTFFGGQRKGAYPTIFIHPVNSQNSAGIAQDADGAKAVEIFRTRNLCSTETAPASVAGCASSPTVNTGCVDFGGCSAPLRWCQHGFTSSGGDPWPCFAGAAIHQFFEPYL